MTNPFTPPGPTAGPPPGPPVDPALHTPAAPAASWSQPQGPWPQQQVPSPRRWSTRRRWVIAVTVTVLCLALLAGFTWGLTRVVRAVAGDVGGVFGCGRRDEALAARLAELPELRLRPPDTEPTEAPTSDCDVLDGYATANRPFESTKGPADVLAFYRRELPAAGWTAVPESIDEEYDNCEEYDDCEGYDQGGPEGITCFRRDVDGATAYLLVYFPSEDGRNSTMYGLDVSGTYGDPDLGC